MRDIDSGNSTQVVGKAKAACKNAGQDITNHSVGVNKMVDIGSRTQREIGDIMLARYCC